MSQNFQVSERVSQRAYRRRRDGVEYKLQVIPGSDGLLELVEQQPRPSLFTEWARAMQLTGWSF